MIVLNTYPEKILPTGLDYCRWNGVYAPALFEFQRGDIYYDSVLDASIFAGYDNKVRVLIDWGINGVAPTDDIVTGMVGNYIRLVGSANYPDSYEVLVTYSYGIIIDAEYIGDETAGFMLSDSFRPNHNIEIQLYNDISGGNTLLDGSIRIRADKDGAAKFNPGAWLKNYLTKSEFDYTGSARDLALGSGYRIKYREVYVGSDNEFTDFVKLCYFTGHSPELGESNNMYDYFIGNGVQGKFLSGFVQPTWFKDYPFDLQWILDNNMLDTAIERVNQDYNNTIDVFSDDLGIVDSGVVRMILRDNSWQKMNVWLNSGLPLDPPIYVERTYVEETYVK